MRQEPDRGTAMLSWPRIFTEFRTKTEFSDLPIAQNSPKSEVFERGARRLLMAPPLPKNDPESTLGGLKRDIPTQRLETKGPTPPTNRNNEGRQQRVQKGF